MDAAGLLAVASLIIIVIMLIKDCYSLWCKNRWLFIGVAAAIFTLIVYFYFGSKSSKDIFVEELPGEIKEIPDEFGDSTNESKVTSIPDSFHELNTRVEFKDGTIENINVINYDTFKKLCMTPEFLEKFKKALQINFNLKKKAYAKVNKNLKQELQIVEHASSGNLLNAMKNDSMAFTKNLIKEIKEIYADIKIRESNLSIEKIKTGFNKILYDSEDGLETLVGRQEIKDFIVLRLYSFAYNPNIFFSSFQNIGLYGGSGYGKTKIAKVIAYVYANCGILVRNKFRIATKAALTTAFVNESGSKTRNELMATLEGIFFLDEAYDLAPQNTFYTGIDHGTEAMTEMCNFLDKMMGMNIVIVAGYAEEMKNRFMKANEGMPRRFPHIITLDKYSSKELSIILLSNLQRLNPEMKWNSKESDYVYTMIKKINEQKPEAFEQQAGSMLNLAADIAMVYYSTTETGESRNFKRSVLGGINLFLKKLNIHISEK